jgi:hypothetical protein
VHALDGPVRGNLRQSGAPERTHEAFLSAIRGLFPIFAPAIRHP